MTVTVLLSSYNGEKYIKEQIESILNQTYKDINIVVRDDGSNDNTVNILKEYQNKLVFYYGKNIGCIRSFWELLHIVPDSDFYAFCDQDDVWDKDKIEIAVSSLKRENLKESQLYFSDVRVVDKNLNLLSTNMINDFVPVDFKHSLIRNLAPGCTFVFNNVARQQLLKYPVNLIGKDMHDWCVYRICSYVGNVVFDPNSHMMYRQHGNNVVGAKNTFYSIIEQGLKRLISGESTGQRSSFAKSLMQIYRLDVCTEKVDVCSDFALYRTDKKRKYKLLFNRTYRLGFIRNMYFKFLLLFNKV